MYLKTIISTYLLISFSFASNNKHRIDSLCSEQDEAFTNALTRSMTVKKNPRLDGESYPYSDHYMASETNDSSSIYVEKLRSFSQRNSFTNVKATREIFKIAIVGGGGAGTIIASLLSNLSEQCEDVDFEITLFERHSSVINGSTFETAAVLHAGGREYASDPNTAVCCQMAGELFAQMFPELYMSHAVPIIFAVNSESSLTTLIQKETHQQAKKIKSSLRNVPASKPEICSQSDIPLETIQHVFSPNLTGGILSKTDQLMKIFERNALLKKYISDSSHIVVKTNTTVARVTKNSEDFFEITDDNGLTDSSRFNHVILTAWDQTQTILNASINLNHTGIDSQKFEAEDRIIALCDINHVAPLQKTPIFTLTGGAMFLPLDDSIGIIYRCTERASYPKAGENKIPLKDALQHGKKIVNEFKTLFKKKIGLKDPFCKLELLGARHQKIVKRSNVSLEKRQYEPPIETEEGIIVALPPKATFIGSLALQVIQQLLVKLPDSCANFKEKWIEKIKEIVPSASNLYTAHPLPEVFTIKGLSKINQYDVAKETLLYFESCQLNKKGENMHSLYKNKCAELVPPPTSLKRYKTMNSVACERLSVPILIQRSLSDPFEQSGMPSLIDLKVFADKNTAWFKKEVF
jgi:hypothetical protein